jgi:hypothetical protein
MRYLIVPFYLFSIMSLSILIGSDLSDVEAKGGSFLWSDDFDQRSLSELEASGWTTTHRDGVAFGSGGVILNGTSADTPIHYPGLTGVVGSDWKVEVRARWLGAGHSGLNVFVYTESHSYGFSADGYYNNFALYRDDRKELQFGSYTEKKGEWAILSMVKEGDTISMFFQGELKNRFVEQIAPLSKVTGVALISPWRGDSEYDYIGIGLPRDEGSSDGILGVPIPIVLIGGGLVGALVAGGAVLTYFLVSSGAGSAAGAAGSAAGGAAVAATPPAFTPPVTTPPPTPASTTGTGAPVQTTPAPDTGGEPASMGQIVDDLNPTVPSTQNLESPNVQVPQDSGGFWHFFTDLWTSIWGN